MVTLLVVIFFLYLLTSLFIGWRRAKSAYLDALEQWESNNAESADD